MSKLTIDSLKKHFNDQKINVLIIGPGKNEIAKEIIKNGIANKIDFIDHNVESIEFQKKLLQNETIELNYKIGELSRQNALLGMNLTYDAILCTEVIEHVTKDIELIKTIHSFLSNDGIAIMSVPNGWIDLILMKIDTDYMNNSENKTGHVNFYSHKKINKIFTDNGFKFVLFKRIGCEYTFFHLLIVLFKIPINGDTGEIYPNKNSFLHKFALKLSFTSMKIILKSKLDIFLNLIINRNLYFIIKKSFYN